MDKNIFLSSTYDRVLYTCIDRRLFYISSFLLFFPSITFGLLTAEVFPWGVIFSVIYLRYCSVQFLLIGSILYFSAFFTVLTLILSAGSLDTDLIRSIAAYMNIILLTQALFCLGQVNARKVCVLSRKIFWGLIFIGFIQSIGSDFLGEVIRFLVPRGSGGALGESNRGVTLLASEPARAGVELTLIYLMSRMTFKVTRRNVLIDVFVIAFQALVIKSASSVAFTLCAFVLLYINVDFKWSSIIKTAIVSVLFVIFLLDILPSLGGRAGNLALFITNGDNFKDVVFYVANESGNRLLALYSFFISGFNHPLGSGVGSWPYSSMTAVLESGVDYRNFRFFDVHADGNLKAFRGPGVISNLFLDIGVLGTLAVSVLFWSALKKYGKFCKLSLKAFWVFLLKILFFGSPGNPIVFVFFICVFLALSQVKYQNTVGVKTV